MQRRCAGSLEQILLPVLGAVLLLSLAPRGADGLAVAEAVAKTVAKGGPHDPVPVVARGIHHRGIHRGFLHSWAFNSTENVNEPAPEVDPPPAVQPAPEVDPSPAVQPAPAAQPAPEPDPPPAVQPEKRTCDAILPLNWVACGSPVISQCTCAALGCCWGGDNPFASELVAESFKNVPPCYYKYGGKHAIPSQEFAIADDTDSTVKLAIDLSSFASPEKAADLRFMIIPGIKTCGKATLAPQVEKVAHPQVGPQGVSIDVKIKGEGGYKVCMNEYAKAADDEQFFDVTVGRISVLGAAASDVMSNGPGGCPR